MLINTGNICIKIHKNPTGIGESLLYDLVGDDAAGDNTFYMRRNFTIDIAYFKRMIVSVECVVQLGLHLREDIIRKLTQKICGDNGNMRQQYFSPCLMWLKAIMP